MATTKNLTMRLRMDRDVDYSDDFRKRFLTKDYGNYEKYEGKNEISLETERGEDDIGGDKFLKNNKEMLNRLHTNASE